MPVLATIAAVSFMFGNNNSVSFFDPESIRTGLRMNLDLDDPEKQTAAFQIVDQLEVALERYNSAVDAAVDEAIRRSAGGTEPARQSYAQLTRLDQDRARVIESVIEYRANLASLVEADEWNAVFGK